MLWTVAAAWDERPALASSRQASACRAQPDVPPPDDFRVCRPSADLRSLTHREASGNCCDVRLRVERPRAAAAYPALRSAWRWSPLGVARQPVVWNRLPRSGVGDELTEAGTNPWVAVDRA